MVFGDRGNRPMNSRVMTAGFLVICFCFCGNAWCQQEPAGEGRPITPAGALVIDAATRLPAVGAMPMTMLRSPDSFRHGGKGRYLLVVNSGYGVQFSGDTNEAQQSIAVIDLNVNNEPMVIQNVYFPAPQSANVGLAFSPVAVADGNFEMYVSGGFESGSTLFRIQQTRRSFAIGLQQGKSSALSDGPGGNTGRQHAGDGEQSRRQCNDCSRAQRGTADGESGFAPSRKDERKHLSVRRGGAGKRQDCAGVCIVLE